MEEWLEFWVKKLQNEGSELEDEEFECYNPINMQSRYLSYSNGTKLLDMYEVVGLSTEMSKTACLISISIHGKVPKRCDCTHGKENDVQAEVRYDHGVTRHGDSVNLTDRALEAIDTLTRTDALLYQATEEAFWYKVDYVEQLYSIKLC